MADAGVERETVRAPRRGWCGRSEHGERGGGWAGVALMQHGGRHVGKLWLLARPQSLWHDGRASHTLLMTMRTRECWSHNGKAEVILSEVILGPWMTVNISVVPLVLLVFVCFIPVMKVPHDHFLVEYMPGSLFSLKWVRNILHKNMKTILGLFSFSFLFIYYFLLFNFCFHITEKSSNENLWKKYA